MFSCEQQVSLEKSISSSDNNSDKVSLQVNGTIPNSNKNFRAINPIFTENVTYKITTVNSVGKSEIYESDSPIMTVYFDYDIKYTIIMEAFTKENEIKIFSGEKKNFIVTKENTPEYIEIPLSAVDNSENENKGTLQIQFSLDDEISSYKIKLSFENKADNNYFTGTDTLESKIIEDFTNPTTIQNISPGTYGMKIDILDSSENLLSSYTTIFSIFPGMITNSWKGDEQFVTMFGDEQKFYITKEKIKTMLNSVFYVKGTNSTNFININEEATQGLISNPFTSIQQAIDLCNNSEIEDYTIVLDGDFTISESIDIPNDSKINIQAYKSSSRSTIKRSASLTNSLFAISENKEITLKNIIFDGDNENSTCTGNGGCLNNYGTLTLNNCEIKNFTSKNGGAIYSDMGTVTLFDTTIDNCKASDGSGGGIYVSSNSLLIIQGDTNTIKNCISIYSVSEESNGGGIYFDSSLSQEHSLENLTIQNCTADEKGGGIYINSTTGSVKLTKVTIDGCTSKIEGAGIFSRANLTIAESKITNCKITDSSVVGGSGICIRDDLNDITINLEKSEISGCGFGEGVTGEGSALYINNAGFENKKITVNITESIIGEDVSSSLTNGEQATNSIQISSTISEKSNKGLNTIYIQNSSGNENVSVNFIDSKVSNNFNQSTSNTGTIYAIGGKITIDENSEICANYSNCGASAIYATNDNTHIPIIELKGKIHHNYIENNSGDTALKLSTILLQGNTTDSSQRPILTIQKDSHIYDNTVTTTSSNAGAIFNDYGIINLEGGILENNHSDKCYEIFTYSDIYVKQNTGETPTKIIVDDVAPKYSSINLFDNGAENLPNIILKSEITSFVANLSTKGDPNGYQVLDVDSSIPTENRATVLENSSVYFRIPNPDDVEYKIISNGLVINLTDFEFYVSSTGDDLNSGSITDPVKTIKKALSKCANPAFENDYIIIVNGTIESSDEIKIDSSTTPTIKKVVIKSLNTEEKPTIKRSASLTTSLFTIGENNDVTFENIIFEGNKASSTSTTNGGCINNSGNLTLTDCTIKNFNSNVAGGTVYNDGKIIFNNTTVNNSYNDDKSYYEVYNSETSQIELKGSTVIGNPTGASIFSSIFLNAEGTNQAKIKINEILTSEFVAKIDVSDYPTTTAETRPVFTDDSSNINENYSKFTIGKTINNDKMSTIGNDGKIKLVEPDTLFNDLFTENADGTYEAVADTVYDLDLLIGLSTSTTTVDSTDTVTVNIQNDLELEEKPLYISSGANVEICPPSGAAEPTIIEQPQVAHVTTGIEVAAGSTLTLSGNLTLQGSNMDLDAYLHHKWQGNAKQNVALVIQGTCIIKDDVIIEKFKNDSNNGSCFVIDIMAGGTLILEGGTIKDNVSLYGAINVSNGGIFRMEGGTITGNKGHPDQANAITIQNGGTFIWNGGTIENNSNNGSNSFSTIPIKIYEGGIFTNNTGNTAS